MVNPLQKAVIIMLTLLILWKFKVNGQISTPCTSSMMSSFTPCLNYITGSSGNGMSSPTADCCKSLKSLLTDSVNCGCLVITGNVPVSLPFNRTLAISLPLLCKTGVPIQCKASGVPLPAPGPVLFGPTQAPIASAPISPRGPVSFGPTQAPIASAPISPRASMTLDAAPAPPPIDTTPEEITPASPPVASSLGPPANPGIKPVLSPSTSSPSYVSPPYLMLTFLGIMVFKSY
ncbi:hypothetical protein ACH5RR_010643 [Cinchona calisaya]|uniref:Bifunctional inhibitor/plant lipid transfer protein/seed storage helical domain-containing protein n=1 Tax=Cinchona calisaya TaxID=153742 RepID=A0ABD3AJL0_9GENT